MTFMLRLSLLTFLILLMTSCKRTPEEMFNAVLDKDILKSAKIIHAKEQQIGDCCIWLHFTVDSIELKKYLKDFKTDEYLIGLNLNYPPQWWHPDSFGEEIKSFWRDQNDLKETFYINKSWTEVYYKNSIH